MSFSHSELVSYLLVEWVPVFVSFVDWSLNLSQDGLKFWIMNSLNGKPTDQKVHHYFYHRNTSPLTLTTVFEEGLLFTVVIKEKSTLSGTSNRLLCINTLWIIRILYLWIHFIFTKNKKINMKIHKDIIFIIYNNKRLDTKLVSLLFISNTTFSYIISSCMVPRSFFR